jgi:hypothetical protein
VRIPTTILVVGSSIIFGAVSIALAEASDFGITESEFVKQHNARLDKRVRVKILERELAPDGLRDVVTYGFGGFCVRGISSTEQATKSVISMTIVPYHCKSATAANISTFAVGAMVMRVLTDVDDLDETTRAVLDLSKKAMDADADGNGVRSANTQFGGRTISLAIVNGTAIIKMFPD